MKRGVSIAFFCFLLVALVSCGSLRHASSEPLDQASLDGYARDHFFNEGIKMFNDGHYDAAMDLMTRSLDYDTASAATCYNLAQYYMSLKKSIGILIFLFLPSLNKNALLPKSKNFCR